MAWNTPDPPRPVGEWFEYSAGSDYRGWQLECGKLFHVHITAAGGRYYTQFNGNNLPIVDTVHVAQLQAEREIVRQVRGMLPAYKVVFARVDKQQHMTVTQLRPRKD